MSNQSVRAGFAIIVASLLSTASYSVAAQAAADHVVGQGSAAIDFTDIDGRIARIPADKRAGFMNDPDRIETTLRSLLLIRQLANEARDLGMDKDPVVQADIELARDEILAKRRVAKVVADLEVPNLEAVARERYQTSPALYTTPETLSVRHVLILRDNHGEAGAKALADKLYAEVKANPKLDFAAFAKQHSEELKSAEQGGLIPRMSRGDTVADFEDAAFALKNPGDISDVVRTRFGYHIIQLVSRTPGARVPYESVKDEILARLEAEFVSRARADYIDRTQSAKLEADPDKVQSLRLRYLPDGEGTKAIARMYSSREQLADIGDAARKDDTPVSAPSPLDAAAPAPQPSETPANAVETDSQPDN